MTTWLCPVGVTKVLVEGWGPGAAGASSAFPTQTGGGGGAGAYGRAAGIPVTPGNSYLVQWTVGSSTTIFGDGSHLNVDRGSGGGLHNSGPGHGGNGGQASVTTADTKFDGGGGAWLGPSFPTRLAGGGGGAAGGRNGAGADGSLSTGGVGADGSGSGGNGSAGSDSPLPGSPGTQPGGGGGAAGSSAGTSANGGAGADGAIAIYDDTAGHGWAGVLAGITPLIATFGSPPAPPTPPANPKRTAFFM